MSSTQPIQVALFGVVSRLRRSVIRRVAGAISDRDNQLALLLYTGQRPDNA